MPMEMEAEMNGGYNLTSLTITGDVLKLVGAIEEFKGAWKAIGRIAPECNPLTIRTTWS